MEIREDLPQIQMMASQASYMILMRLIGRLVGDGHVSGNEAAKATIESINSAMPNEETTGPIYDEMRENFLGWADLYKSSPFGDEKDFPSFPRHDPI